MQRCDAEAYLVFLLSQAARLTPLVSNLPSDLLNSISVANEDQWCAWAPY